VAVMRGIPRLRWPSRARRTKSELGGRSRIRGAALPRAGLWRRATPYPRMRWAALAVTLAATLALSFAVIPKMYSSGDVVDTTVLPLGAQTPAPHARASGTIIENSYGYVLTAHAAGKVDIPLRFTTQSGQRSLLRLWASGLGQVDIRATLIDHGGRRHFLGRAQDWIGRPFDVTSDVAGGSRVVLEVSASNPTASAALILDQVAQSQASPSVVVTAQGWIVGVWLALIVSTVLLATNRLRRHWMLAVITGIGGYLLWRPVPGMSLYPLDTQAALIWPAVQKASWLGFHSGLWWGSWAGVSSLAVQLFHAVTPLVGTGSAGALGAGALLGIMAVIAIYAVGNRVAGRRGAVIAAVSALLADSFRLEVGLGTSIPVLALAAALFLYAVHVCLTRTGRQEIILLAGAGLLMCLANPMWIPGIVIAIVVMALAYAPAGQRMRVLGVGLLALALLILPNRISTADQNGGDPFADINHEIRSARNFEFAGQDRHGAPSLAAFRRDPTGSGSPVGLGDYLFVDHSVPVAVGATLTGGYKAIGSFAVRDETKLAGLLAFVLMVAGLAYLLILPRLRMLFIVPLLVSAPSLFLASRHVTLPFEAGMGIWPALLVGSGVLVYAISNPIENQARAHLRGFHFGRHSFRAVGTAWRQKLSGPGAGTPIDTVAECDQNEAAPMTAAGLAETRDSTPT
jgi:hypothetical protein